MTGVTEKLFFMLNVYVPFLAPMLAIPLACYRIGFGPPARNRKKIGKI